MDRLPIDFYIAHSGELLRNDLHIYDRLSQGYDWLTPEAPKPFRNVLMTTIDYSTKTRAKALNELHHYRSNLLVENVTFDSGGFQMLRRPEFTIKRLIDENLHIYKEYDWADTYIMPDHPPSPGDSDRVAQAKWLQTVGATRFLFEKLPSKVQERSMPVFHVRNPEDIIHQWAHYKDIIEISKKACYAIPGARKRLDIKNARLIKRLSDVLPEGTKLHSLGIASPPAIYCMYRLGVHSYDAISPRLGGANGSLQFPYSSVDFTSKRLDKSISIDQLEQIKKESGHRCPFCDRPQHLLDKFRYRVLHNLIIYDEFNWHFRDMTMNKLRLYWPKYYNMLSTVMHLEGVQHEI